MKKKKLLFVMPSLGGGGAEKVVFNLLVRMPHEHFETTLFLFCGKGQLVEKLDQNTNLIQKAHHRLLFATFDIFKNLRQDYDIIFSSGYHNLYVALLAILLGKKEKLILRETSIISTEERRRKYFFIQKLLVPLIYQNCALIVFQSQYGKSDFEKLFNIKLSNTIILPNPALKPSSETSKGESIFIVGRLDEGKNVGLALKLIKISNLSDIKIEIFGDGPQRHYLENLANELDSKVIFHGYEPSMENHWSRAQVHVMTSLSESMPNVVIEAAIHGVPSICMNAPGGLEELFSYGEWGKLVHDESQFSLELQNLRNWSLERRHRLHEEAVRIFCENAVDNYLNLLKN